MVGSKRVLLAVLAAVTAIAATASAQVWTEITPASGGPTQPLGPNGGGGYDPVTNRMVVFLQTNNAVTGLTPEVWVLTNANGTGGAPSWILLAPTGSAPNANGSASIVYDRTANRLIVYGGCTANCSPARDTVWVLSNANGLGGTPAWTTSTVTSSRPRVDHRAVLDEGSNTMVTFGGHFAFYNTDQTDVERLSNANGTATPSAWTEPAAGTPPSKRSQYVAVYHDASDIMTIFGGQELISSAGPYVQNYFNDTWGLLDAASGAAAWFPISPTGTPPSPRSNTPGALDETRNMMYVFGGYYFDNGSQSNNYYGDLWRLTTANGQNEVSTWSELTQSGDLPGQNQNHWLFFDPNSGRLVLYGGSDGSSTIHHRVFVLDLPGTITIAKQTNPDASPQSFTFDTSAIDVNTPTTLLMDGQTAVFSAVASGTYRVDEILPPGWALDLVACTVDSGLNSSSWTPGADGVDIVVNSGQNVTCTFNNRQLVANLAITKEADRSLVYRGETLSYTIEVSNSGPDAAVGVVADSFPPALTDVTWTCTTTLGATCGGSGNGDINDAVTIPAGASVTYVATGTVSDSASGAIENTATVSAAGFGGTSAAAATSAPAVIADVPAAGRSVLLLLVIILSSVGLWVVRRV